MTGAYAFTCKEPTTDNLLHRLNQLGGWKWVMGDSHWYGDYVATVPFAGVRIRIVDFPGRTEDGQFTYECDVRRAADCPTTMEEVDAAFRAVLEQLPARDVHEIEWFD